MKKLVLRLAILLALIVLATPALSASRVKDIADVEGIRDNLLVGYGLVVGLNGTGDSLNRSIFTRESLIGMLERLGVNSRDAALRTNNVAAVMVTATLPPFSRQGGRIDVTVIGAYEVACGGDFANWKIAGQKGWHGVAIASGLPLEDAPLLQVCREGHARCVGATVAGVEIHNFYIPAGGDVPDRAENPKFDHKLNFYETLTAELSKRDPKAPLAIVGDLNVAPGENDVWNHKYMSKIVSHTPAGAARQRDRLRQLLVAHRHAAMHRHWLNHPRSASPSEQAA